MKSSDIEGNYIYFYEMSQNVIVPKFLIHVIILFCTSGDYIYYYLFINVSQCVECRPTYCRPIWEVGELSHTWKSPHTWKSKVPTFQIQTRHKSNRTKFSWCIPVSTFLFVEWQCSWKVFIFNIKQVISGCLHFINRTDIWHFVAICNMPPEWTVERGAGVIIIALSRCLLGSPMAE